MTDSSSASAPCPGRPRTGLIELLHLLVRRSNRKRQVEFDATLLAAELGWSLQDTLALALQLHLARLVDLPSSGRMATVTPEGRFLAELARERGRPARRGPGVQRSTVC